MPTKLLRPSPAVLIAVLALFVALGGPSYAAKMITGKQIKNNSVTGRDIKNGSLTGKDVKDKSVTGKDIKNGSVTSADLAADAVAAYAVPLRRVPATSGVNEATARLNAPEIPLLQEGPITVYGKCYVDATDDEVYYGVYVKTATAGTIVESRTTELEGGDSLDDFLNPGTDETNAVLETDSASANESATDSEDESDFTIFGADGTALRGWTGAAVKNGTVAASNGPFGAGDVCLFTAGYFVG